MDPEPQAVYLEVGKRRTFACSLDWPGWCRSAKTEESALEALAAYTARYSAVPAIAGIRFPARPTAGGFDVAERLTGNGTTDFGAPGVVPEVDSEPVRAGEARRMAALVAASWTVLDEVAAQAPPTLRKGPRGGGRDRDAVVEHVLGSEVSYARTIGVEVAVPALGDAAAIGEEREAILEVLGAPNDGHPTGAKGWPTRYAARRMAWHVLDHAWEVEDKSEPPS